MKTALSSAGSDCSGGAGIPADLKTMAMNGVYGMSAVTALTAQNTTGVKSILEVSPQFLEAQIDAVFTDIVPDAVKVGMVVTADLAEAVALRLRRYEAVNIVVDPVMVSTSGSSLMRHDAVDMLTRKLFPLASLVTPNIPEGEALSGLSIRSREDMERAARKISADFSCPVLLKGGHALLDADDLLCADGALTWFRGERIDTPNTHGTGCTLSSAIAANLAKGFPLEAAVRRAKEYVSGALAAGLDLGKGAGPMDHGFVLRERSQIS